MSQRMDDLQGATMPPKGEPCLTDTTWRSRLLFVAWAVSTSLFCLLVAQFFRLQVVEHARWARRAASQHYFTVTEPFRRGQFFANTSLRSCDAQKKIPFAIDVPLHHLYADPKAIPPSLRTEICSNIIRMLSPSLQEAKKLGEGLKKKSRSRRLVTWVPEQQKGLFVAWWRGFAKKHKLPSNALFFVADYKRFHPMGHVLGQVLHTIQERRDEQTGRSVPTGGLELSLNTFLDGSPGRRRLMRSPHNNLETGEALRAPVHGADVELTINHCLQAIVEEELERGVIQHKAKAGTALMVDPRTGEILALAQYPFFFPDRYQDYFNEPALSEHSKLKAISDAHEPGSPMKALTAALALKANRLLKASGKPPVFHVLEKVPTSSGNFAGRSKPLTDVSPAKHLNFYMALQKSSNVYLATLAARVVKAFGENWYREQLIHCFGLGQKSGIELVGESVGMIPKPGKVTQNGRLEWSKGTPYTLAIGYNLQVTAVQFARAFCVIANGGILPELTLIRKISRGGDVLVDNTSQERTKRFPRVFEQEDMEELTRALKFVTKAGGSAVKADVNGYTEAGKTGTSMKLVNGQYTNRAHFSSFVGFAPAKNPAFVLFVALDEPMVGYVPGRGLNHRGGTCATPMFREIGRRALEFLGVPMDDPFGFPVQDPRSDPKKADWAAEVEALHKLYVQWNA